MLWLFVLMQVYRQLNADSLIALVIALVFVAICVRLRDNGLT